MRKKTWVIACFLVISFLLADSWAGTNWRFIGFNRYRDALYVDENRVEHVSDGTIQLWVRLTVGKKSLFRRVMREELKQVPKKEKDVKYLEMKESLDCEGQRIRHLEIIYYNYNDQAILQITQPRAKWKPVVPGSLWYELWSTSCHKTP